MAATFGGIVNQRPDAPQPLGQGSPPLLLLAHTEEIRLAHEIQFQTVDVEAFESLDDQRPVVIPHFRMGVVQRGRSSLDDLAGTTPACARAAL